MSTMDCDAMLEEINDAPIILIDARPHLEIEFVDIYLPNVPQMERYYRLLCEVARACFGVRWIIRMCIMSPDKGGKWGYIRIKYHKQHHEAIRESLTMVNFIRSQAGR